jgi:hypothetical protein
MLPKPIIEGKREGLVVLPSPRTDLVYHNSIYVLKNIIKDLS